jgi:hypothetical protein
MQAKKAPKKLSNNPFKVEVPTVKVTRCGSTCGQQHLGVSRGWLVSHFPATLIINLTIKIAVMLQ